MVRSGNGGGARMRCVVGEGEVKRVKTVNWLGWSDLNAKWIKQKTYRRYLCVQYCMFTAVLYSYWNYSIFAIDCFRKSDRFVKC